MIARHSGFRATIDILPLFPKKCAKETILAKHLITHQLQICLLIVIYRDKDNTILCKQISRQHQSRIHKHQPCRMGRAAALGEIEDALGFILGDRKLACKFFDLETKRVIVDKAVRTGVIRRIDVDALHLPLLGLQEVLQRVEVVAGDIDILTLRILRLRIVLFVRHHNRRRLQRSQKPRIVFAEKLQLVALVRNRHLIAQPGFQLFQIQRSVAIEAHPEVLLQHFQIRPIRRRPLVLLHRILNHRFLLLN